MSYHRPRYYKAPKHKRCRMEDLHIWAGSDEDRSRAADFAMFYIGNKFADSLREQMLRNGDLSDKQVAAAAKSRDRHDLREIDRRARQAQWQAERDAAEPVVPGRRSIEGEVVSVKQKFGKYGESWKMIVREDSGAKVWGTIPAAVLGEVTVPNSSPYGGQLKARGGARVRFTATVKVSDDDPKFGFYNRPANAEVVA